MKKIAIAVILLCLCCSLYSQDAMSFDGILWLKLTDEGKAVFICGLSQGEWLIQKHLYDLKENVILELISLKAEDGRTIMQVIRSIDTFYTDNPKRLNIPVVLVYSMLLDASKVE